MIRTMAGIFILCFSFSLFSLELPEGARSWDDDGNGVPDRWEAMNEKGGLSIYMDTSGDGEVDYLLEQDDEGYKSYEAVDFNHDGEMDDYYFYTREVLVRREIDSNFDGRVDIWVKLSEGVYVEGYERDTDFDGIVDMTKKFGDS